ncbi:life-span regulatory factor protein [Rutstroemia sp. NJR-2017a BVV2]|nr:life-span regulatory factor protein [Rutstroemia sp. NJR-2017a BVV2]
MSFDMDWSPDFCLACDRQTDGRAYCSESCRLAEYEKSSSNENSTPSSPSSPRGSMSWPSRANGFYMEPAYNFSNAQPYGTTPSRSSHFYQPSRPQLSPITTASKPVLTPSSSQSSLFSMQSTTSSTSSEPAQLSPESKKALKAYASSFDHSRYSRRQSTH